MNSQQDRWDEFAIRTIRHCKSTDIRKAFGATVAVDGVSFRIEPATCHALLGENGAGKSTIVKLLSGLMRPDEGHISGLWRDEQRSMRHAPRMRSASRRRSRK